MAFAAETRALVMRIHAMQIKYDLDTSNKFGKIL